MLSRPRDKFSMRRVARALALLALGAALFSLTSFVPFDPRHKHARATARAQRLAERAQRAYEEKRYGDSAEAYGALIEQYPFDFVLHFNRACALAHDGKPDDALESLGRAVRYGFEDVDLLSRSKALQPLRSDARFAQLESDARASREERVIVHVPPNLDRRRPAPLVVLIHGRGSTPRSVLPAWTSAADRVGVVLALPKAPTRLAPGRYGWEPQFPTDNAQLDWTAAQAAIDAAIDAALAAHAKIDRNRIVLAGFSQGGYVALRMLHERPRQFTGVITFVTVYHPDGTGEWRGIPPKRAYLIAGSTDPICAHSHDARDDLRAAGFDVRYEEIEGMGHEVPPEYEQLQVRALRFVL